MLLKVVLQFGRGVDQHCLLFYLFLHVLENVFVAVYVELSIKINGLYNRIKGALGTQFGIFIKLEADMLQDELLRLFSRVAAASCCQTDAVMPLYKVDEDLGSAVDILISLVKNDYLLLARLKVYVLVVLDLLRQACYVPQLLKILLVFGEQDVIAEHHMHFGALCSLQGHETHDCCHSGLSLAACNDMDLLRELV